MADNLLHFNFKRASSKRAAKSTKARINATVNRVWLNLVVNKLSNHKVGEVDMDSLEEEKKKLAFSVKSP